MLRGYPGKYLLQIRRYLPFSGPRKPRDEVYRYIVYRTPRDARERLENGLVGVRTPDYAKSFAIQGLDAETQAVNSEFRYIRKVFIGDILRICFEGDFHPRETGLLSRDRSQYREHLEDFRYLGGG